MQLGFRMMLCKRNRWKLRLLILAAVLLHVVSVASFLLAFGVHRSTGEAMGNQDAEPISQFQRQKEMTDSNEFGRLYAQQLHDMDQELYFFDQSATLLPLLRRLSPKEYNREHRIAVGKAWLRRQNVVIAGTIRNGMMEGLANTLENLGRLRAIFNSSWLVLVESNSVDNTRSVLYNLSLSDPSVRLLGCDRMNSPDPCNLNVRYSTGRLHIPGTEMKRTVTEEIERGLVMSALRNIYLNYIYDHLADQATLLLVIDPDIPWMQWDLDNIAQGVSYFQSRPRLQQICAHATLGKHPFIFDPCTIGFYANKHFGEDKVRPIVEYYTSDLNAAPDSLPPIKADSCFQAFAFYRLEDLVRRRLRYRRSHGERMCEHNTLSRQLSEVYLDLQMKLFVDAGDDD